MRLPRFSTLSGMLVLLASLLALPWQAYARDRDESHRDEIRHAVEAGAIRSLAEILAATRGQLPGEVAGVHVERDDGRWLYEFRVVDDKGRLFDVYVDARSGKIERIKEK